jgi:hypothetical protein
VANFDTPDVFAARWLAANNILQRYPSLTPDQIIIKLNLCPVLIEDKGWEMRVETGGVLEDIGL